MVKKRGESARSANRGPLPSASSPATIPSSRYLFFGGKGGVGKTTAASAAALYLLDRARSGENILLFSTDPAHSLSDSLGVSIGDRLVEIAQRARARLFAFEMDANRALAQFKEKHRAILSRIAERGTILDESDINELLNLSLPGMDEVMALFELSELDRAGSYQRIVIDTAPSGHTSRLLRLPAVFARWIGALDLMAEKHRYMIAHFVRRSRMQEDEVDLFLRDLSERIERVRAMIYDRNRASFVLVTIAEAMAVEETARYFEFLRSEGVPVTDLIINRVEQERADCQYCSARAAGQKPHLKRIASQFGSLRLHKLPLMAQEVRGIAALRRFARITWEETDESDAERKKEWENAGRPLGRGEWGTPASPRHFQLRASDFILEPRRLLIFGGKGGVGKTTAAAVALALAEVDRQARVLIFSTDPAHSLSDSFDEAIGEFKQGIAGQQNLDGMEIDPIARFEELKNRYRQWTDKLFDSLTGNSRWEIQFDREAMRELVALAPPGIDEIAALSAISDLLGEGGYSRIVLDTAPTGHLVRFLELPDVALSWVRTFIKLLLKYREVIEWSGIAEELVALSKNIKRVAALLSDREQCEFIGVAIPERMSLEETVRLTGTLERLKVPLRRLLINNVMPAEAAAGCSFCAARRRAQQKVIADFRKRLGRAETLFIAPQQPREIRGRELLRKHFAHWQRLVEL